MEPPVLPARCGVDERRRPRRLHDQDLREPRLGQPLAIVGHAPGCALLRGEQHLAVKEQRTRRPAVVVLRDHVAHHERAPRAQRLAELAEGGDVLRRRLLVRDVRVDGDVVVAAPVDGVEVAVDGTEAFPGPRACPTKARATALTAGQSTCVASRKPVGFQQDRREDPRPAADVEDGERPAARHVERLHHGLRARDCQRSDGRDEEAPERVVLGVGRRGRHWSAGLHGLRELRPLPHAVDGDARQAGERRGLATRRGTRRRPAEFAYRPSPTVITSSATSPSEQRPGAHRGEIVSRLRPARRRSSGRLPVA